MIARAATAQDDITGDGTTSNVLFIGEIMRQAERYLGDGIHPRIIVDGLELAKVETLKFLEEFKQPIEGDVKRELLVEVAASSLNTKIHPNLANPLTEILVDAVGVGEFFGHFTKAFAIVVEHIRPCQLKVLFGHTPKLRCVAMIVGDVKGGGPNREHIVRAVHQGAGHRLPVNQFATPVIKDFNKVAILAMIDNK